MQVELLTNKPSDYVTIIRENTYHITFECVEQTISYYRQNSQTLDDDVILFYKNAPKHYKYIIDRIVKQKINYKKKFSLKFTSPFTNDEHTLILNQLNQKFESYNSDIRFIFSDEDPDHEIVIKKESYNTVEEAPGGYKIYLEYEVITSNFNVLVHEIIRYLYAINDYHHVYQMTSSVIDDNEQAIMEETSLGSKIDLFSHLHVHNLGVFFEDQLIINHEMKILFLPLDKQIEETDNPNLISDNRRKSELKLTSSKAAKSSFEKYLELTDIFDMIHTKSKKDLSYRFRKYDKLKLLKKCKEMDESISDEKLNLKVAIEEKENFKVDKIKMKKYLIKRRRKNRKAYLSYLADIGLEKKDENIKIEK